MRISVYGVGYVGLIVSVCFANIGHQICSFDIDNEKIHNLRLGKSSTYEPFFNVMLASAIEKKTIQFTDNVSEAATFSNFHFICVGTPMRIDGAADLSSLFSVVESLATDVQKRFLVIIKSTVPVGTSDLVAEKINETLSARNVTISFDVVSCPEFMAQGEAVLNFFHPERIIIGTKSKAAFEIVKEIYAPLLRLQKPPISRVLFMSPSSAELAKYASNLFLATKISFVNELSRIAEFTGANINEVIHGMTTDSRIGPAMSKPGCGFGGSCFPKDLNALIHQAEANNYIPNLLHAVQEVNKNQKLYFIKKIFEFFKDDVRQKIISVWGLSFKPNTDDLRGSISCEVIEELLRACAKVQAYDPVSGENARNKFKEFSNFKICASKEEALNHADLLVVMTEWPEFFAIDAEILKKCMKKPVLFDGRNMYDPNILTMQGISYFAIGIGFIPPMRANSVKAA